MAVRMTLFGLGKPEVLVLDLHGEEEWLRWAPLVPPEIRPHLEDYLDISADRGARPLARRVAELVHARTGLTVALVEADIHRGLCDTNRLLAAGAVGWPVRAFGGLERFSELLRRHRAIQSRVMTLAKSVRLAVDCHTMAPRGPAPIPPGERDPRVHSDAWRCGDGNPRPIDVVSRIDGAPGVPPELTEGLVTALSPFGPVALDVPYSPVSGFLNAEVGKVTALASFDLPKTILAVERGTAFDLARFAVDDAAVEAIAEAIAGAVVGWLRCQRFGVAG